MDAIRAMLGRPSLETFHLFTIYGPNGHLMDTYPAASPGKTGVGTL